MKGIFSATQGKGGETVVQVGAHDGPWQQKEYQTLPPNVHPDAVSAVFKEQMARVLGAYFGPDGPGRK